MKRIENSFAEFIKPEMYSIAQFFIDCRWIIAISCALFLGIYGPWLFNTDTRIDTNFMVDFPESDYNWKEIGRQGLLLTEKIWGISKYNPHMYSFFGFLMVFFGATMFGYLFWRASRTKKLFFSAFAILAFLHPVLAEQFYFELQLFQIGWAYIITAAACGLAHLAITRKSVLCGVVSVALMAWSFSSYQAFVFIYIASVSAFFLLRLRRCILEETEENTKWLRYIGLHIFLFLLAFLINFLITKQWFTGSDYLTGQIAWGVINTKTVWEDVKGALIQATLGDGVFFSKYYIMIALLVLAMINIDLIGKKINSGVKILWVLSWVTLQVCPFIIIIFLGHRPVIHAYMAYPFVIGVDLLILLTHRYRRAIGYALICLFSFAMIWSQVQTTERLLYTDRIRAKADLYLAEEIQQRVYSISTNKRVAFIGKNQGTLNAGCQMGEMIGLSLFNVVRDCDPKYLYSTESGCRCFQTLGYSLSPITEEQIMDARVAAASMPSWPAKDSVKDCGEFIVVKLSEDEWPDEVNQYAPGTYESNLNAVMVEDGSVMSISLQNYDKK